MRTRRGLALGIAAVVMVTGSAGALAAPEPAPEPAPQAQAAEPPRDGSSSEQAAASCWEIKQDDASATDGVYWLLTPAMRAPEQFACDMTTDGGGWVLVGRGRENWRMEYEGTGTTAQVREQVTGQAAFNARQLSSSVIDDLLNDQPVRDLQDGIRLRRATNVEGTSWQEARFSIPKRDRWVWTFAAEHVATGVTFDGASASGGQTSNFGSDNRFRRVQTTDSQAQSWTRGFAFGSQVTGSSAASSYLWSAGSSVGSARPFTQVWLRPRLTDVDFPAIPDEGTPAIEQVPLVESRATPSAWGVTGLATGGGELRTEVQAFTQVGDTMYVGGNFRYVQRDSGGSGRVEQSFLAAFDVDTGEWRSDFRPVLDNQVKALAALDDGTLVVGGDFGTANGDPLAGVVLLDPETGQNDPDRQIHIENGLSTGTLSVRSLKIEDGWLYLGGAFTHLADWPVENRQRQLVYARSAARVSLDTLVPDRQWNPNLNGAVNEVEPSAQGDRVYAAGYFDKSGAAAAVKGAAFSTAQGAAVIPWTPRFSAPANFQFTVTEAGDRVWLGGSEHSFFSYDRGDLSLSTGNITKSGGDFQTSAASEDVVYGGCHCGDFSYSGAYTWSNIGTSWTQADKIGIVGAWDRESGDYLPDFNPITNTRAGYGAWASLVDDRGQVWLGGSYDRATMRNGASQWVGGFVRYAPRDSVAPTTPEGLSITPDGVDALTLSWSPSTDDRSGTVRYDVLRDDRVIATTTARSLTVPRPIEDGRWFVRAVDTSGNASASTPVSVYDPGAQPATEVAVAAGSTWSWRNDSAAVPAEWPTVGFDDSSWSTGTAPLGFGSSLISTDTWPGDPGTRPLSTQFRTTFTVEDPGDWDTVDVSVWVDDGALILLNGTEIGRGNLRAGPVTQTTYATAAPRTGTASAAPLVLEVPASGLREGENVLAVQSHLNYRRTPDSAVEATLTLRSDGE